jgi:hypothetical protein
MHAGPILAGYMRGFDLSSWVADPGYGSNPSERLGIEALHGRNPAAFPSQRPRNRNCSAISTRTDVTAEQAALRLPNRARSEKLETHRQYAWSKFTFFCSMTVLA